MCAPTQSFWSDSNAVQRGSSCAGGRMSRGLGIMGVCLLGVVCETSITHARSAKLPLHVTVVAARSCASGCVDARGRLSCSNFLTTPYQYPCADYKVVATPCGWQLHRVFMCR